ncbi:MAG: transcription termination factor Rho [Planctomycetia bacterium]
MAPTRKPSDDTPARRKAAPKAAPKAGRAADEAPRAKPAARAPKAASKAAASKASSSKAATGKAGTDKAGTDKAGTDKASAAKGSEGRPEARSAEARATEMRTAEAKSSKPVRKASARKASAAEAAPDKPAPTPPAAPAATRPAAPAAPATAPASGVKPAPPVAPPRPAAPAPAAPPAAPARPAAPGWPAPPTVAWGSPLGGSTRPIPPLPDEEADPEPYEPPAPDDALGADDEEGEGDDEAGEGDDEPGPWTPGGPLGDAQRLLSRVTAGQAHVSELGRLGDGQLVALAQQQGWRARPGEGPREALAFLLQGRGGGEPAAPQEEVQVEGLLELHPDGYGFLRRPQVGYIAHPLDVYVPVQLVRRVGLKAGHWVSGKAHRNRPSEPTLALHHVLEVNHEDPARLASITPFEKLTVVYPDERYTLEARPEDVEMRLIDLFCPLGRGQRGLIVAPPRSGKTVILQKIADSIARNHPQADIVVLLVDERPEEVTNMRRSVRGEVIASTFDKPVANHVRVAELAIEKVKRMVEMGRHVVMLLDSITRLGRAYNNLAPTSGRILSGGMDAGALTKPKNFFAAARNVEGGGSLTILATALVDTGSRLDQLVFEEFKGSGNMEVVLDRELANQRIWPAINIPASGTRNEDLLLHPDELRRINRLRRALSDHAASDAMLMLKDMMKEHATNAALLLSVQ